MEKRVKNILLTGGSGFLGRHIKAALEAKGYKVFAPRSSELNLETREGEENFFKNAPRFDCLIHSAAYYGGIGINQSEPATIFYKNSLMAVNVFDMARIWGVKKILPIGSACSYPGYQTGDLKEENFWNGPLHDTVEAYGFSKKLQLVAQKAYRKQYGLESNHLVLTNLYGPYDTFAEYRSHVVSALIKKFADAKLEGKPSVTLWGDGSPIREFLYVEDAAEVIALAVELESDPEPVNVGTGVGTSIKELAETIMEIVEYRGELIWDTSKPNGAARKVLDISKMKEKLNWTPKRSLREGLEKTIKWYMANKAEADKRL